jgi:hypothetical protein
MNPALNQKDVWTDGDVRPENRFALFGMMG